MEVRFFLIPAQPGSSVELKNGAHRVVIAWRYDELQGSMSPVTAHGVARDYAGIWINGVEQ
jgi:hypothetical protein